MADSTLLTAMSIAIGILDVATRLADMVEGRTIVPLVVMEGGDCFGRGLIEQSQCIGCDVDRRLNITVKSYDGQKQREPTVTMSLEDRLHLTRAAQSHDHQIVIIDDLVETGSTIRAILNHEWIALETTARPLLLATLLTKLPQAYIPPLTADRSQRTTMGLRHVSAFDIPSNRWVYGFGMDLDGKHRDLPCIMEKKQ